jgi:hypothetical protein
MAVALISGDRPDGSGGDYDLVGPLVERTFNRLSRSQSTYDGVVVDLREQPLTDDLLEGVASLRKDLCWWVTTPGVDRPRMVGVVLLVDKPSVERELIDYAALRMDCPSFWFATGCEIVIESPGADVTHWMAGDGVKQCAAALKRLSLHPLIADGDRGAELFRDCGVDALGVGRDAFLRRIPRDFRMACGDPSELRVVLPSTYQLEGGATMPLPGDMVGAVFRHVVTELTGKGEGRGRPSEDTGFSVLHGRGSYYSEKRGQHVEEAIQLAQIQLEISRDQVRSLVRYLRFAWLQDSVFCTLNGKVVQP